MNKEQFIEEISKLGINLTENQLTQLDIYCKFLLEYNSHTNLPAIKEEDQVYLKHFYDSLTFIKAIDVNNYKTLIDIGTGAGFPGMVLKIVFPELEVTLLDSNNKKINFLKELTMKLGLTKINFFHGRAEEFCVKNREKFDIVTARAVSNMTTLSELCLPLTKLNGYFVALKGSNKDELEELVLPFEAGYKVSTTTGQIASYAKPVMINNITLKPQEEATVTITGVIGAIE